MLKFTFDVRFDKKDKSCHVHRLPELLICFSSAIVLNNSLVPNQN